MIRLIPVQIIRKISVIWLITWFLFFAAQAQSPNEQNKVPAEVMQKVYEEVKTPYKYGLVIASPETKKKIDCPSVFRKGKKWYMTYIIYDGRGYETWLAKSKDLLHWKTMGRILSFSNDTTQWDYNQKAGYIALQDYRWGGSYKWQKYRGKHWMSYFGGSQRGYEAGILSIGIAYTGKSPVKVHEWQRLDKPVLMPTDPDVRWWENATHYKSSVLWDKSKITGYPFVMYYNARGDSIDHKKYGAERIGMAVSGDMTHWKRFEREPVLDHFSGITGDAVIQRIGDVWVMFYFGFGWKKPWSGGTANRFACSYNLVHWTDWNGKALIAPSESYDAAFAHKSFVVKHKGVVYHFYCAVNKKFERGIAVATSVDKGKSIVTFVNK